MKSFFGKVLFGCLVIQASCNLPLHGQGFTGAAAGAKIYAKYAPPQKTFKITLISA